MFRKADETLLGALIGGILGGLALIIIIIIILILLFLHKCFKAQVNTECIMLIHPNKHILWCLHDIIPYVFIQVSNKNLYADSQPSHVSIY